MTERKQLYFGFAFVSVILLICGFVLHKIVNGGELARVKIGIETVVIFFMLVAVIYSVTVLLWRNICRRFDIDRNWTELFVDTGLMAICKYFPGKIWGIMSRGAVKSSSVSIDRKTVSVSILEQIFVLAVGGLLFGLLLLFSSRQFTALQIVITGTLLLGLFVLSLAGMLTRIAAFRKYIHYSISNTIVFISLQTTGYVVLWFLTALPILVLINQQMSLTLFEMFSLIGAFIGAVVAGWVALFAPGGIGIRESVFVVLAPTFLSWQEGLYWITVHRALITGFDLVFGLLAISITAYRIRIKREAC